VPDTVAPEQEPAARVAELPAEGSAERRALEHVAGVAWVRLGNDATPPCAEVWSWWLASVWALHADRIRAAFAHEVSL
jgi:hypothetical protein